MYAINVRRARSLMSNKYVRYLCVNYGGGSGMPDGERPISSGVNDELSIITPTPTFAEFW